MFETLSGAAGAVKFIRTPFLILGAHEIGQDFVPGPTGIAKLSPVIVVLGLPPHVEQSVNRTSNRRVLCPVASRCCDY